MKTLPVIWQRLVSSKGTTCARCHNTGEEIVRAIESLRLRLEPLGVIPVLEMRELDETEFLKQPSESNRIWIAGKPLEEWINGQTGSSRCCDECGDNDCRTIEVGEATYEIIPEGLLVRAALAAASQMLDSTPQDTPLDTPDASHGQQT